MNSTYNYITNATSIGKLTSGFSIKSACRYNYRYDKIGNLVADKQDSIAEIVWNVQGKVQEIKRTANCSKPDLLFKYDAMGRRVSKTVIPRNVVDADTITTFYVHDAQGNVMATYENKRYNDGREELFLSEQHLYGPSRLGIRKTDLLLAKTDENIDFDLNQSYRVLGEKNFELSSHTGNVLAVVSDKKLSNNEPDVKEVYDYFPYGSYLSGRTSYDPANSYLFGYNTQEKTDEISGNGNHYTAPFWEYNPQVVQRWNIDPKQIIGISPYVINGNNPIYYTDLLGDFRTKFGANVYKFFHGGDVVQAQSGNRAGEYYVSKKVDGGDGGNGGDGAKGRGKLADGSIELDEVNVTQQIKWNWGGSTAAEYVRGGAGAIWDFGKFLLGGGGSTTYGQGSFESDEMASSMGVKDALKKFRNTSPSIGDSRDFGLSFSPSPKNVINKTLETGNPLDGFSQENKDAHIDAFKDQSWTKLYVGGYTGTMTRIDANTVKVIIWNNTTANSFLLHGGELIFGKENGAKRFNDFWNKTPLLNTQSQIFEFTIPYGK